MGAGTGRGEDERGLSIPFRHTRWSDLVWGALLAVVGGLILLRTSGAFRFVSVIFLAPGLSYLWRFVETLLHDPGKIAVSERAVDLTPRLCAGRSVIVPLDEISAAYVLKRATPLFSNGPMLVLETKKGVFQFPRRWFEEDGDQRRVAVAIARRRGIL